MTAAAIAADFTATHTDNGTLIIGRWWQRRWKADTEETGLKAGEDVKGLNP